MAASTNNPADLINQSLAELGVPHRVGSLYDGSTAAQKALDIYAETRDEVLRSKDWPFALRQANGVSAAANVSGWAHTFNYPSDCLRVRYIAPQVIPTPNNDPQQVLWSIANDVSTAAKVITTQITPITINYVGQITDPTQWEPLFVSALVQALATKLGPSVRKELAPALNAGQALETAAHADDKLPPNDAAVAAPQQQRRAS